MNQKILNWNLNLFYLFQVLFDHIHDVHGDNDHSGATLGSPHHRQVDTHERLCSGALNPPPLAPARCNISMDNRATIFNSNKVEKLFRFVKKWKQDNGDKIGARLAELQHSSLLVNERNIMNVFRKYSCTNCIKDSSDSEKIL